VDARCLVSFSTFKGTLRQKFRKPKDGFLEMTFMGLNKVGCASHDKMSLALWVITYMIWPCQAKPVPITVTLFPLCSSFCHEEANLLSTPESLFLDNYLNLHMKHRGMSQLINNYLAKSHYQQASGEHKMS